MNFSQLNIIRIIAPLFVVLFLNGCTEEHHKLEKTSFLSRVDFTETLVSSEQSQQISITFQPQINSGFYHISMRFPRFEYDPGNHAMPDTSYWEHLIDGMAMKLFDENGSILTERELNTIEHRRRGFGATETHFSAGLRNVPDLERNKTYNLIIEIPAIHDPQNKFPDMLLRVGVSDPKFYFEHWTR